MNEVIKLISETKEFDHYGDTIVTKKERVVFVELKSIGQSEYYQANALGLKPEIKFVIADYLDYNNEKRLLYKPINSEEELEYSVIRTFRKGTELEIVCKRGVEK